MARGLYVLLSALSSAYELVTQNVSLVSQGSAVLSHSRGDPNMGVCALLKPGKGKGTAKQALALLPPQPGS